MRCLMISLCLLVSACYPNPKEACTLYKVRYTVPVFSGWDDMRTRTICIATQEKMETPQ